MESWDILSDVKKFILKSYAAFVKLKRNVRQCILKDMLLGNIAFTALIKRLYIGVVDSFDVMIATKLSAKLSVYLNKKDSC